MPFTQKSELGAFQSCSLYLWYEIQILYDEGEKHRRDAGWGFSSSYIFSMSIRRTCHPAAPSLPPSLSFSHRYTHTISSENISLASNIQGLLREHNLPGGRQIGGEVCTLPVLLSDLPEIHLLPFTCKASRSAWIPSNNPTGQRAAIQPRRSAGADRDPQLWTSARDINASCII